MDYLLQLFNFIMENWEIVSVPIFAILSLFMSAGKLAKLKRWIEEAKQVYRKAVILLNTVKRAFDDKHLTKEEMKEIKDEIEELIKEIKDLF